MWFSGRALACTRLWVSSAASQKTKKQESSLFSLEKCVFLVTKIFVCLFVCILKWHGESDPGTGAC
jgi:hypothetical protein